MSRITFLAPLRSLADFQQLLITHQEQGYTTMRFHQKKRDVGVFSFHYDDLDPDVPVYAVQLDAHTDRYLRWAWVGWYIIDNTLDHIENFKNNVEARAMRELIAQLRAKQEE